MADVSDLTAQVTAALGALSTPFSVAAAGTLQTGRVVRGAYSAALRVSSASTVVQGSNLSVDLVELEVDLAHRAAGSSAAQLAAGEAALALLLPLVARESFWADLAAVRVSPVPQISIEGDLQRIGETVFYTVRAGCALEGA